MISCIVLNTNSLCNKSDITFSLGNLQHLFVRKGLRNTNPECKQCFWWLNLLQLKENQLLSSFIKQEALGLRQMT